MYFVISNEREIFFSRAEMGTFNDVFVLLCRWTATVTTFYLGPR